MGGDPEPAARTDRASRWTSRLDLVIALTTLFVAVAYVALRFAYTRFYDALGVAPEELGLGQVDLLVRSAGLIVVFALPAAVVLEIAALAVGYSAVGSRLNALWALPGQIFDVLSDRRTPRLDVLLVVVGVISWIVLGFAPLHTPRLIGYLPPALALTGAVLVYIHRRGLRRLPEDVGAGAQKSWETLRVATAPILRRWRIGAMLVAAASTVLAFVLVSIIGPIAAQNVQQGQAYRDWSVPWRADPATVRWLHQAPANDPLSGRCLMYLGQANGIAVLYDVQSRRVVRVPASEVVILVETGSERCPRRA